MNRTRIALLCAVAALASGNAAGSPSVYELTLKGKACEHTSHQSLECNYRVGKSLYVSIAGIGQPDTGIAFMKSDFDGDFYAQFGVGHGCVIIGRGKKGAAPDRPFDFAFISPKNGKVYSDWQECKAGY
jgi:hypothetical protein